MNLSSAKDQVFKLIKSALTRTRDAESMWTRYKMNAGNDKL